MSEEKKTGITREEFLLICARFNKMQENMNQIGAQLNAVDVDNLPSVTDSASDTQTDDEDTPEPTKSQVPPAPDIPEVQEALEEAEATKAARTAESDEEQDKKVRDAPYTVRVTDAVEKMPGNGNPGLKLYDTKYNQSTWMATQDGLRQAFRNALDEGRNPGIDLEQDELNNLEGTWVSEE